MLRSRETCPGGYASSPVPGVRGGTCVRVFGFFNEKLSLSMVWALQVVSTETTCPTWFRTLKQYSARTSGYDVRENASNASNIHKYVCPHTSFVEISRIVIPVNLCKRSVCGSSRTYNYAYLIRFKADAESYQNTKGKSRYRTCRL